MVKRNSTRARVRVRAFSSGRLAGSSNLVECTRDLIEIAARVTFVYDAIHIAIHALNGACLEIDSETSSRLSRQAREALEGPLSDLSAKVRTLQQFLKEDPPSETTGITISVH
jgi:hypothetical protein